VLGAHQFKCSVHWAKCDALNHAYVDPRLTPPAAFVPEGDSGIDHGR
jgi:transcriptional regulator GlxA family with amidase domain